MKIYFAHGKESGPIGTKINYLRNVAEKYTVSVESIDYRSIQDPDDRVEHLVDILKTKSDDIILVGSSMGGYVSLAASEKVQVKGLFLMAPALYMPGYKNQTYNTEVSNIVVVHGWKDDIIPLENVIAFSKNKQSSLHIVDDGHTLNNSLEILGHLFDYFLGSFKK